MWYNIFHAIFVVKSIMYLPGREQCLISQRFRLHKSTDEVWFLTKIVSHCRLSSVTPATSAAHNSNARVHGAPWQFMIFWHLSVIVVAFVRTAWNMIHFYTKMAFQYGVLPISRGCTAYKYMYTSRCVSFVRLNVLPWHLPSQTGDCRYEITRTDEHFLSILPALLFCYLVNDKWFENVIAGVDIKTKNNSNEWTALTLYVLNC